MDVFEMASQVIYVPAQCVNCVSDVERQRGGSDLTESVHHASTLLDMLDEWGGEHRCSLRTSTSGNSTKPGVQTTVDESSVLGCIATDV